MRRLLFEGKNAEATELAGKQMMGRPFRIKPYQVLADLWLEGPPPGAVRGYRRELNLSTGIARLSYQSGAGFTRELFASAPDRVIVLRIAADEPGAVNTRAAARRAGRTPRPSRRPAGAWCCAGASTGPTTTTPR